jgi:hypothetical protein
MPLLQGLAVALLLSAPLRLGLQPHAASMSVIALDRNQENPQGASSAGFFMGGSEILPLLIQ